MYLYQVTFDHIGRRERGHERDTKPTFDFFFSGFLNGNLLAPALFLEHRSGPSHIPKGSQSFISTERIHGIMSFQEGILNI